MDGDASVFSRRAHFCVWVHLDGREFSTIGSVALFSCTRDTYKIWTLSLACVICTAVSSLSQSSCATRIIAQNILGRHHICTTKLNLSIWPNAWRQLQSLGLGRLLHSS